MTLEAHLIKDWSSIETELLKYLNEIDYKQNTVVVRHFAGERMNRVLRTGTDRTKNSSMWNHGYDWYFGKKPTDLILLTYAWTIDFEKNPMKTIRFVDAPTNFNPVLYPTEGMVMYDSSKLERKSECEYHFLTSPLDAMLGVIITPQTTKSDTLLQEKTRTITNYLIRFGHYIKHISLQKKLSNNIMYTDLSAE